MEDNEIRHQLAFLGKDLLDEILSCASLIKIQKGQDVLHYNQYVKAIPIVLNGSVKVFTTHESKELLLYYIKQSESCIMTFMASLDNKPSKVVARAMVDTKLLMLPLDKIDGWLRSYPRFSMLFFKLFNTRYLDLLDTINHLLFDPLDTRVLDYIKNETNVSASPILSVTHKQIALELGTSREVVSRILKKMEREGTLGISKEGIRILII